MENTWQQLSLTNYQVSKWTCVITVSTHKGSDSVKAVFYFIESVYEGEQKYLKNIHDDSSGQWRHSPKHDGYVSHILEALGSLNDMSSATGLQAHK